MTTIALFGATGRTGGHVLDQALKAGHEVRALARRPAAIRVTSDSLEVVQGDVLDRAAVNRVVEGADLVISVFGRVKDSPDALQTDGTRNIVESMKEHGVTRIISLSGGGLPAPQDKPKVPDRVIRLLLRTLAAKVLRDAAGHLKVLQDSGLDWTVVRGPVLTDAAFTGVYRVGWVGVDASTKIGRADLADFILHQVHDHRFDRQMPFVSY